MSDEFNPDEFINSAPPSPGTQLSGGEAAADFDPDAFIAHSPEDSLTGQPLPLAFSGLTPETAMNKSIVDFTDRLKMSVGNKAGNINYLKSKFQDVRPIKDEKGYETDEIAVQKDGQWYRVDPSNGEISDPWEKAKEYAKDLADAAPLIGGAAAGIATGGAALAAPMTAAAATGAGTALVRTSLGRIIGTYDATPAEQAFDIGLETLLNVGGAKVAMGVKPTASWMADKLDNIATAFKDTKVGGAVADAASAAVQSPKNALKYMLSAFSVGTDNFDTMLEHTQMVKATMKNTAQRAGRNVEAYHDDLTLQQVNHMHDFADSARTTLSSIYGSMKNKILAKVSPTFSANFDEPIVASYRSALAKGIGKIEFPDGASLVGKEALEWLETNGLNGVIDAPAQAMASLGKSGRIRPRFSLLSQKEMEQAVQSGAALADDLGFLATNAEAHATVSKFFNAMGKFAGSAKRQGVKAADDLLNFKRVSTDLAYDLANTGDKIPFGIKRILDESRAAIDNEVLQGLNKAGNGLGNAFMQLNKTYSQLSNEMKPILQARARYQKTGDISVYQALTNRFLSRPGANVGQKYAIDAAIDAAKAHGLTTLATDLAEQKTFIQVAQAAKAFNPIQPGWSKAANVGGIGMGAYSVLSGNVPLMAAVATAKALQSPATPKAAVLGLQAMHKGQEMISSMSKSKLSQFLSSPQALQGFINGIGSAPQIYDQTHQALQGQIQQTVQGQAQ